MAQNTVNYSNNPTGPQLLDDYLAKDQENHLTCNSGIQRPSYAQAGSFWLDISSTPWILKFYDGTNDIAIGSLNATSHVFSVQGVDTSSFVNKTGDETIAGVKTFTSSPVVPTPTSSDNSTRVSTTAFVKTAVSSKADDNSAVHKTGDETITGLKTFTNNIEKQVNVVRGQAPSSSIFDHINFCDKNNNWLSGLEYNLATDKSSNISLIISDSVEDTTNTKGRIEIGVDRDGNVFTYSTACDAIGSIVTTTGINKGVDTGYWKFGNGLIIQRGYSQANNARVTVTLPTPFTTNYYSVVLTVANNSANELYVAEKNNTSFKWDRYGGIGNNSVYWIAIGF